MEVEAKLEMPTSYGNRVETWWNPQKRQLWDCIPPWTEKAKSEKKWKKHQLGRKVLPGEKFIGENFSNTKRSICCINM